LPPAVVNSQSTFGTGVSPQVAVDPVNPLKVVAVASNNGNGYTIVASFDGGQSFANVGGGLNITDPHIGTPIYSNNTDAPRASDRAEQVYVVMREHDAGNTSGSIVFQRFNFAVSTPAQITHPIANKVLYTWDGHDAAYNPVVAVDNNAPSYTDPATGAVQID